MENKNLTEKILKYIDGKLTPDEEKALAAEIDGDPQAEKLLADMILMHGNMPSALQELEHMSESTMAAIQRIVEKNQIKYTGSLPESEKVRKSLFKKGLIWAVTGTVAACLLVVLGLPMLSSSRGKGPSLDPDITHKRVSYKDYKNASQSGWEITERESVGNKKPSETSSNESPIVTKEDISRKELTRPDDKDTLTSGTTTYPDLSATKSTEHKIETIRPNAYALKKEIETTTFYESRMDPVQTRGGRWSGKEYEKGRPYPPDISSGTEQYQRYAENNFYYSLKRPLSTFSIDVDTASYSNIRRFILRESRLPNPDAVRIEEMINYFEYNYPQPVGKHPFSLYTEVGICPWNTSHKLIHIGLQGKLPPDTHMPNSNLVFLLDVSGSMSSQNKLPLLKQTMKLLVSQLRKHDRVSIVTYASRAQTVLGATSGSSKQTITQAIDRLHAGGSTAGEYGLLMAYDVASRSFMEEGNNRIIVASDGDFNVGMSRDSDLVQLIEKERKRGIFLTILGFGTGNIKDAKLEKIANKGNGHYAYIDSILEGKKVMLTQLKGTLHTIAKDVKIQVEFNPANVKAYRLIGYENRKLAAKDFHDDTKDAGELGAGHTVTALYELIPAGSKENIVTPDGLRYQVQENKPDPVRKNELMTLKLRYKFPAENKSSLIQVVVPNKTSLSNRTSHNFRFSAAVAEFGLMLRNSKFKGNSNLKQVIDLAKSAKGKDKEGHRAEFIKMAETAELLIK